MSGYLVLQLIEESSFQRFRGGHVQKIEVKCGFQTLLVKCSCLPEMRKDRIYNILVRINLLYIAGIQRRKILDTVVILI